jgi:dihydropteroate synthase
LRQRQKFELEIGGRKINLGERTLIMGVVNVTPDSFSDGGRFIDPQRAIRHGIDLARAGADWLDIGGESTRPGALPVSASEELRRVLPVIGGLHRELPHIPVSIDTTKAEVASEALRAGATIVNDVSGLRFDPELAKVARRHRAALVLMHLRGKPQTMQRRPFARSLWRSVLGGLETSIRRARAAGIPRSRIIIDPGFGFGKSRRQNFELLAHLEKLARFRLPLLIGTSRKSFVQAVVAGEGLEGGKLKQQARFWALGKRRGMDATSMIDFGDAAAVVAAILAGAHIVRVHNVAAALPAVRIADSILASTH